MRPIVVIFVVIAVIHGLIMARFGFNKPQALAKVLEEVWSVTAIIGCYAAITLLSMLTALIVAHYIFDAGWTK